MVNPCLCWQDYLLCAAIIHMQMFSHDPRAREELQLASVTLKDFYTAPYNHSAELRASERKGSASLSLHVTIQRDWTTERERECQCTAVQYGFESFSKTFSAKHAPLHSDRVQLFGKYLIAWPCVCETCRKSTRSCF